MKFATQDILRELYEESMVTQGGVFLTGSDYLALDLPDSFKKRLADEEKKKNDITKSSAVTTPTKDKNG